MRPHRYAPRVTFKHGKLARRLALPVLLGVLTTYLTAWALTLPAPGAFQALGCGRRMHDDAARELFVDVLVESSFGQQVVLARADEGLTADANGPVRRLMLDSCETEQSSIPPPSWFTPIPRGQTYQRFGWRIAGWPFRCVRSCTYARSGDQTQHLRGGIHVPELLIFDQSQNDPHRNTFPLLPWWPGFLPNTAIFTAPWALLLLGPRTLHHHLRLRQGHCPRCGYNVNRNYSAPCPECGYTASNQQVFR
jgi:hypothetical protein